MKIIFASEFTNLMTITVHLKNVKCEKKIIEI
jgi:hypothetical protein